MSNFIEVKETKHGDTLILNVENVVAIHPSGCIYTNAIHGEQTGLIWLDQDSYEKLVKLVTPKKEQGS